jgi:hypothetical protein
MKTPSIKKYLRPSTIMSRKSTFANAFASALAPYDEFSIDTVSAAMRDLGQDPDADLTCVYCGDVAATWDHVFNRVVNGEFSGYGHRIRNLVPCCRTCNERKGGKHWRVFLDIVDPPDIDIRIRRMECFLGNVEISNGGAEPQNGAPEELERFLSIRGKIFELMAKADELAAIIRQNTFDQSNKK